MHKHFSINYIKKQKKLVSELPKKRKKKIVAKKCQKISPLIEKFSTKNQQKIVQKIALGIAKKLAKKKDQTIAKNRRYEPQ